MVAAAVMRMRDLPLALLVTVALLLGLFVAVYVFGPASFPE